MSENTMPQSEAEFNVATDAGHHAGGFLAGLLLGGLAGAGTMLLLAPHSGKHTRADIHSKGVELRDQATERVEEGVAQARSKTHRIRVRVRKEAKALEHRGQEMLDEQVENVSGAIADVKATVQGH